MILTCTKNRKNAFKILFFCILFFFKSSLLAQCLNSTNIYYNNFDSGVVTGWSTSISSLPPIPHDSLGPFGAETITYKSDNLSTLPCHDSIKISFRLILKGSWDGNGDRCCGTDTFIIKANSITVYKTTFSNATGNHQSYPAQYYPSPNTINNIQFTGSTNNNGDDWSSYNFSFTFPHIIGNVIIQVSQPLSNLSQPISDESWYIDNFSIDACKSADVPLVTITPVSSAICPTDSIILSATGALTYSWSPALGLSSNSGPSVKASPLTTTTYTVTGANANCSMTDSAVVIVKQKSLSTIDQSICQGQSYDGYTIEGTYIDTLTNAYGCDSIRTLHLIVDRVYAPPPTATIFNTGTNNAGGQLPGGSQDLNWKVSANSITGPYSPAIVFSSFPPPPWDYYQSPWPDCQWVSHSIDGVHNNNEDFFYKYEFRLPCTNPCGYSYNLSNSFCLNLDFFSDNSVYEIYVNGHPQSNDIGNMPLSNPYYQGGFKDTGIRSVSLCRDWKAGSNSLIVHIASGPNREGFLAQASIDTFPPVPKDTIIASLCKGDTLRFGTKVLTDSGFYVETFHPLPGCDSIVALKLKLLQKSFTPVDTSICEGQTFMGYAITGTYTLILRAANGCDSIVTIKLLVKKKSYSDSIVPLCRNSLPFFWNGRSYTGPVSDSIMLTNYLGCDSVARLHLSLMDTSISITTVSVCRNELPFQWGGKNYTGPGRDSIRLNNYLGCDSVAKLSLSIRDTSSSTTVDSVCFDKLPYLWRGGNYRNPGTYTKTWVNSIGCDSSATLVLHLKPGPLKPNLGVDTFLCPDQKIILNAGSGYESYLWQDNSKSPTFEVSTTGLYYVTVKNSSGCEIKASKAINIINNCGDIYFPNAFSPGKGDINKTFGALGNLFLVKNYQLNIYNRYGQVVFSTGNPYQRWDGVTNGKPQLIGNYIWKASYILKAVMHKEKRGNLILVR